MGCLLDYLDWVPNDACLSGDVTRSFRIHDKSSLLVTLFVLGGQTKPAAYFQDQQMGSIQCCWYETTFILQFNQLTSKFARISIPYRFSRMWQKKTGYVSKRMFKIFLSHAMFFSLIFTRFCSFLKIFFSSLPSERIDIVIIPISHNECDRLFLEKEHSEML